MPRELMRGNVGINLTKTSGAVRPKTLTSVTLVFALLFLSSNQAPTVEYGPYYICNNLSSHYI